MRESTFRRALADRLGAPSVNSYVSFCRRVERDLQLDLDACDLSEPGIAQLAVRLRAAGVPERSVSNSLSALRAYAGLDRVAAETGTQASAEVRAMNITPDQRERWAAGTAMGSFNRWLEGQVRDQEGRLDLSALHRLALGYGVDKRDEYRDLNPGQQRMNLGNVLRRLVPKELYEGEPTAIETTEPQAPSIVVEPIAAVAAQSDAPPPSPLISESSVGGLLTLYGQIMDELRRRQVVRTGNSPVGDYAELLFAKAFGWRLEGNSASGHDAVDEAGLKYQIKGRRLSSLAASRQLSAIRRLNDRTFDVLAAVLFDPSFKVMRAVLVPHDIVVLRARRTEHTNSWIFLLDDKIWREPGVRDVTAEIAVAASRL